MKPKIVQLANEVTGNMGVMVWKVGSQKVIVTVAIVDGQLKMEGRVIE